MINILKNKFFIVFCIVAIFVAFSSPVFASDNKYSDNDLWDKMYTDAYSRWCTNKAPLFMIGTEDNPSYLIIVYDTSKVKCYFGDDNLFHIQVNSYSKVDRLYYDKNGNFTGKNNSISSSTTLTNCTIDNFYFCQSPVYNDSGEEVKSVFYVAPLIVEPVQAMEVTQLPGMIAKVVKIVLPVCLGVLGILLVIYLIKSKKLLQI